MVEWRTAVGVSLLLLPRRRKQQQGVAESARPAAGCGMRCNQPRVHQQEKRPRHQHVVVARRIGAAGRERVLVQWSRRHCFRCCSTRRVPAAPGSSQDGGDGDGDGVTQGEKRSLETDLAAKLRIKWSTHPLSVRSSSFRRCGDYLEVMGNRSCMRL